MKKNAIVIASIMFVAAGCASNGTYYGSSSTSDYDTPPIATQHDPAAGNSGTIVTGTEISSYHDSRNPNQSVNDFHADSSIRGGSNEARGYAGRNLPTEGAAHPLDRSVQADSSIRGGSNYGRFQNKHYFQGSLDSQTDGQSPALMNQDSAWLGSNPLDLGEGKSDNRLSGKDNGAIEGSANWNSTDDLLEDGTESGAEGRNVVIIAPEDKDVGVGGAASSEVGTASSAESYSLTSRGASKDLNSSPNLERNIAGQYSLEHGNVGLGSPGAAQLSGTKDDLSLDHSSTAVGGPGSTETGIKQSSDFDGDSHLETSSSAGIDQNADLGDARTGYSLFQNNRAQGVGSAATAEIGRGTSVPSANATKSSDDQLAEKVKGTLTRESTGTFGPTSSDVARNVQVSSRSGTVTLKGTVSSQKAKDLLEIRAREVSGVKSVDNQLTISREANSSVRNLSGRNLEDVTDQLLDQAEQ